MIDLDKLPMRVGAGQFNEMTDELLQFIKQCGCDDILLNGYGGIAGLPGDERWEFNDLVMLRSRAEDAGLRLMALENVPLRFYDKIMLGLPGRERQIENMCETVRNMGRAGIPILGYHFMPNGVWRTSRTNPVRGGAKATSFNMEIASKAPLSHGKVYTEDEMWENYDWYLDRILPVCEEFNVHLALHPDDPPVGALGGIARLFRNFENFKRAMDQHPSPMHGLDYCHGCWSEMRGGEGVLESIRYFGERGRIFYVHFRDVQGAAEDFTECFVNEGNSDMLRVMITLKQAGFKGFLIDDHVPHMAGDTPWGHRGRAYAIGYMTALLEATNKMA